uniref:PPPDE domain-containing protein n=1 Tax=Globisporangium ultimum (strain ATCC 200006 / CBS 805.95 / DAOM BR144) TaxID=431595 RepID=K3WX62_GLOUD
MAPRTALTPVYLNIYDLTPANGYISALGFGFFHSGIEIAGDEYSFASGAGIFTSTPKQAAGSYTEAKQIAYSLRSDFEGNTYNLVTKNCNAYSEALCRELLGKSIPAYVNRAAYLGSFLSCLMPADLGGQAPVGATSTTSSSSRLTNGPTYSAFAVRIIL